MVEISAILVNYNSSSYTLDCIESMVEKTNPLLDFEIIVVDNASREEEFQLLQKGIDRMSYPFVKYIAQSKNVGFGEGNNIGVAHSQSGKYLAFVNNDVLFRDDCLQGMKDFIEFTPDCGICSPQSYDGEGNFVPTFDYLASPEREWYGRKLLHWSAPSVYKNRHKKYSQPMKVPFVSGSFMFMYKEDFLQIGQFDPNIFLYYEETDLSIRMKKILNKDTYLVPQWSYTHFISKSTQKNIDIKTEQKLSLLYIIEKHYGKQARNRLYHYLKWRYGLSQWVKPKYRKLYQSLKRGADLKKESMKNNQTEILNR